VSDDFDAALRELLPPVKKVKALTPKESKEPYSQNDEDRQSGYPYEPAVMVQLIIDNPNWTHKQYAKHFGRTTGWFASVLASDNFQQCLDLRRSEVADPSLTATLEERFRALTLRSLDVLQVMLDNPKVQDATVLKAAEIGIKALGLGMKKDEDDKPKEEHSLDNLADRLTALLKSKGHGQGMIEHRTTQQQHAAKKLEPTDVLLMELKEVKDE
jgi:hypothetical protein